MQWGTCWRKRWKVTKEGDKVKAIKLAKPEREVPALEPVENWTEEDKARANRNPNVTRLTEPLTANGHVVDAELVEDAYCFSHDKFLIPPPDCFHYTEGKEGVRYDGEKIATYMLEEVVTPWPGYCSDGKFGRKPAGPLDEEGIER